jgi:hypothetical protein
VEHDPDVKQLSAYEAFRIGIPAARVTGTTEEALRAAWLAFRAAEGIARALAAPGEDAGDDPPVGYIQGTIAAFGEALANAPTLVPDRLAPDMVVEPVDAAEATRYLLILGLALNASLPAAAERSAGAGDRAALFRAGVAARDLACCFDERLRPDLTDAAAFMATEATSWPPAAESGGGHGTGG